MYKIMEIILMNTVFIRIRDAFYLYSIPGFHDSKGAGRNSWQRDLHVGCGKMRSNLESKSQKSDVLGIRSKSELVLQHYM